MTKKPGIVDPWRRVEPLVPTRPVLTPAQERINIADMDMDVDLRIAGRYVIRSPHASFDVTSLRIDAPGDAVAVLADCLIELSAVRPVAEALAAAGVGVRCADRMWNVPSDDEPSARLEGNNAAVWFAQRTLATGMLVLARILREPAAANTLHKHGVVVMIAA